MTEQFITFETAKLAKKKGFAEGSHHYYGRLYPDSSDLTISLQGAGIYTVLNSEYKKNEVYEAPIQSMLQKWLREKHSMHIVINYEYINNHYTLEVLNLLQDEIIYAFYDFNHDTYEEILEKGLQESLKAI